MYEKRDQAWKDYRKALNEEPLENYQDLRDAFNAGWIARKDAQYKAIVTGEKDE